MTLSRRRALLQAFSRMHQAEQQENEANDHERDQRERLELGEKTVQ